MSCAKLESANNQIKCYKALGTKVLKQNAAAVKEMNAAVAQMNSATANVSKLTQGLKNFNVSKYVNGKGLATTNGGKRKTRRNKRHTKKTRRNRKH